MAGRKSRPPMPLMGILAVPGAATASSEFMGHRDKPGGDGWGWGISSQATNGSKVQPTRTA